MKETLHFANPSAQTAAHRAAIEAAVARVLDGSVYIHGVAHDRFEQEFAKHVGVRRVTGVANGTDAILLALKALDIGAGHEVLVPSHTATASASAIRQAGAEPVFVDIDPRTYLATVSHLEAAMGPRVRAVLGVHLYGCPLDAPAVRQFCDQRGLKFIEDCAQATGARWRGARVGTFGHLATFSFFPTKNLGAIGDGGAVASGSDELAQRLVRLRTYGWSADRISIEDGFNSRLDELQAAILLAKLPHVDADNDRRRALADAYRTRLAGLPIELPVATDGAEHAYHLFVIALDQRDELRQHMAKDGINAGIHYPVPNHCHPAFASARHGDLGATEAVVRRILTLPMYPELSDESVDRVVASVRSFFAKAR